MSSRRITLQQPSKENSILGGNLLDVLNEFWGYNSFRPHQLEVIQSVLRGTDTIALLPTGGGKSICFQVPGVVLGGVTIVVSPLISLMQDQVSALAKRGIGAFSMTGMVEPAVFQHVLSKAKNEPCFFLYLAPERLASRQFARVLKECKISQLAVDEAHCISSWGHDFRPSYRQIALLRPALAGVPVTAVTATATPRTVRDIRRTLRMKTPTVVSGSFDRPNISFSVFNKVDARISVIALLSRISGAAIVYETSREGVEVWAEKLKRAGVSAVGYHAGMEASVRERAQAAWMRRKVRVIVATNAFGMGIDRPDVRLVIHVGIPESMEAYYQEAGRAGRDGEPSEACLIVTPDATHARRALLKNRSARRRFEFMRRYADRKMCRRWAIMGYFGEQKAEKCGSCDVCVGSY
jgi:ATP-dependent DNA helicase RecQ